MSASRAVGSEAADLDADVVAIDGPGGSGKSTVSRALAAALGAAHLDTGAMYRAVTQAVLRDGVDPHDGAAVSRLARAIDLAVDGVVTLDGEDVTAAIRSPEVTALVSTVSAHPAVRAELVRRQREWVARRGRAVVEGRDVGSVVFPRARLKVFLTASEEERARRRLAEHPEERGDLAGVAADLARRDRLDSTRVASPLTVADGAVVVDTTGRDVEEIVAELLAGL